MKQRALTDSLVYFPANGAVVRLHKNQEGNVTKREIVVRLVYADVRTTELLLEALKNHET
jgi:hypothetical protein